MNRIPLLLVPAVLIVSSFQTHADEYLGAEALLKQAAKPADSTKAPNEEDVADSPKKLLQDLKCFRETSTSLPPEEAASRWHSFADRLAKLSREDLYGNSEDDGRNLCFSTLVESLPPPVAWDALVKAAAARPEGRNAEAIRTHVLRLTTDWLTGDAASQKKEMGALQAIIGQIKNPTRRYATQMLDQCQIQLLQNSDDGQAIVANLNAQLDRPSDPENPERQPLSVPDLVSLVGAKEAATFLKKALKNGRVELQIEQGEETRNLARKLALQMVDELKQPQWALAQSLDSAALFEALSKRFPKSGENDDTRRTAQAYYLLHLIATQKTKEAIAVAKQLGEGENVSLPSDAIEALERAGHTLAAAAFLHDLLEQNPELPFWDDYVRIAPKAGCTDQMVTLAEAASVREGLTPKERLAVLRVLTNAYLAADDVEKGVATMRKQIQVAKEITGAGQTSYDGVTDSAATFAELGIVLARKDLADEGIQAIRDSLKGFTGTRDEYRATSALDTLARLLVEANRGPEAEGVLGEALRKSVQPVLGRMMNYYQVRPILCKLLALYHEANRPADVLALLDQAPFWGAKDLKELCMETVRVGGNSEYVGYLTASALASAGRTTEALPIVEELLENSGGYDPAYELLIQIAPDTAMAKLDELIARDPFEERPLIWKAKQLVKSGNLEEAEKCARQAIAIDPTDGEQGPGRRLRAYATLGEIREARGDKKEADFLKGVLTSVQHSDKADRLHTAGLITRALKLYEESLTHFADAYCIQARLAFRMAELGDMAGAEEHYRRAYELMPDSFGRVESYCFGCEGAFQGSQAQGIAERVFTKLAKESPQKPQIHYLLGYLRSEQNRDREALLEFREAVKLDPDYLNAWKKLAEISGKLRLPAAERDEVQLNLLRLDPLGRHSSFEFERVSNMGTAWTAMENAAKLRKPAPASLYPLAASADEIQHQQEEVAKNPGKQMYYPTSPYSSRNTESPGKRISELGLVNMLNQFYLSAPDLFRD